MTTLEIKSAAPVEGKHGMQWQLEVQYSWSKYSERTWIEQEYFPESPKPGTYEAMVEKRNQKPNNDGSQDFHWNWNILELKPTSAPAEGTRKQDQPSGDYNTGMAFNQACTLVAAMIGDGEDGMISWGHDDIIDSVLALRFRLYHDVLMQPIDASQSSPNDVSGPLEPSGDTEDEEPLFPPDVPTTETFCPVHQGELQGHDMLENGRKVGECYR